MDLLSSSASGITLRQLYYFTAVAEDRNYTRAAERLFVSQPSLSRQVRELEEALGVTLFVRDVRGVRLTGAGTEMFARGRALLAMLEVTIEAVRATEHGERKRLRLGYYGPSFYNNAVTRNALERFRAESPDVDVVSHEMFGEEQLPALREGRIDVCFPRAPSRASELRSSLIAREPLVALVAESDPLARESSVSFANFAGRDFVLFPDRLGGGFNAALAEAAAGAGVSFRATTEVTQMQSMVYLVARGDAITVVPASSMLFPVPGVVTRSITDPSATVDLFVTTRRNEASEVVLRFLDTLLKFGVFVTETSNGP